MGLFDVLGSGRGRRGGGSMSPVKMAVLGLQEPKVQSWVSSGANQSIEPHELEQVLGDEITRRLSS